MLHKKEMLVNYGSCSEEVFISKRILGFSFLFSFCSMLAFLLTTRLVGEWAGDLSLWSAICSGIYLCALGLGIFWAERKSKTNELSRIGVLEVLLASLSPVLVFALYLWHMYYRISFYDSGVLVANGDAPLTWIFACAAQGVLVILGFLGGLELGLINRWAEPLGLRYVQRIIAIYHLGGLGASIILLSYLSHTFEWIEIALGIGGVHLLVATAWIVLLPKSDRRPFARTLLMAAVSLGCLTYTVREGDLVQTHLKNFYYNHFSWQIDGEGKFSFQNPKGLWAFWKASPDLPRIERHRGPYQTIDFVPDLPKPDTNKPKDLQAPGQKPYLSSKVQPSDWTMFMDGHFQVNSRVEAAYHRSLAHVPNLLRGKSGGSILILGGGDGLLAREILKGTQAQAGEDLSIDLIDIDPLILHLACFDPHLLAVNDRALLDPRVTLISGDAFQTLRHNHKTYDAIYMDVLFPFQMEHSRLYSYEFFALIQASLRSDGVFALLSPVDFDTRDEPEQTRNLGILSASLGKAGFPQLVLFGEANHSFLFARREKHKVPDAEGLRTLALTHHINPEGISERIVELPSPQSFELANSLIKPRFFGLKDPFF